MVGSGDRVEDGRGPCAPLTDSTTRVYGDGDGSPLGSAGFSAHQRREVIAALVALNGGRTSGGWIRWRTLAERLGISPATISADVRRPDVLARSRTLAASALSDALAVAWRSWLLSLASRAAGGDDAAGRLLGDELARLGLLAGALGEEASGERDADTLAAVGIDAPGAVFADAGAAAELARLLGVGGDAGGDG